MRISDWSSDVCSSDLFFLGAMVLHVGEAPVVFSGFASPAFWLVFGGLVIGAAVDRTGLGQRIARALVGRFRGGYLSTVTGVVTVRSEEHTSELQSLMRISYAVFCLKKKK